MKAENYAKYASPEEQAHDDKLERNAEDGCVCPLCGSPDIELHYYDYGQEPTTGMVLNGYRFQCSDCGEEGEYE